MNTIKSVTFEPSGPALKDVLKAVFFAASGRPGIAKHYLSGNQKLVARDENNKAVESNEQVIGIPGDGKIKSVTLDYLQGNPEIVARDKNNKLVIGISGGSK